MGVTRPKTFDDNIIAIDKPTTDNPIIRTLPGVKSFIFAIFSKAKAIIGSATDIAKTDFQSTVPINLKANPIAKTAPAIRTITDIPSFNIFLLFSLPAPSKTFIELSFFSFWSFIMV